MGTIATSIAKNTVFNSSRFLVITLSTVGTSVIIARFLGPEEFGIYRMALGCVWILEVLTGLAFPTAVTKYIAEFSGEGKGSPFGTVVFFFLKKIALIYICCLIPFIILRDQIGAFYHSEDIGNFVLLGAISVLPGAFGGILAAGMQGLQRFRDLNTIAVLRSLVQVSAILLLFIMGYGIIALFVFLILLNVFNLAISWWYVRKDLSHPPGEGAVPRDLNRRMWRYGLWMGLITLFSSVVWERSEIFFLGRYWDIREVGFYSLSFTIALHVRRALPASIAGVLFPVISRLEGIRDEWGVANAYIHSTRYLAALGLPIALSGIFLSEPIILILFGAPYAESIPVLTILLASAGFTCLGHPAVSVIMSKECFRFLLVSSVILAAANLVLDFLLIRAYAALGAAVANSTVQIAAVWVQMAFAGRTLKTGHPIGNLCRIMASSIAAFLPALLIRPWAGEYPWSALGFTIVTFLILYPFCLIFFRAARPEDFTRLRHIAERFPRRMGKISEGIIERLENISSGHDGGHDPRA